MKIDHINIRPHSWGKYIFIISLSLFILIFSYLLGNTSFPFPKDQWLEFNMGCTKRQHPR